eukprot:CAMPEP_0204279944 /NCGR_PEP_ID=MMETSP0468-20130131/36775_1 /ASSEMBLY_ACC=CAM_ASM_000383 /TAXON_ID=2969 /ORGANISM="Oxyrrhis marina" /LENGTH=62 /DNA_ID=CAMNT_0051257103 /DNA_START=8 /DNA_END=193 /DNA_ORIENTATION=-
MSPAQSPHLSGSVGAHLGSELCVVELICASPANSEDALYLFSLIPHGRALIARLARELGWLW